MPPLPSGNLPSRDVEGAASASGTNKAIPAPSSATDLPLSGGSAGVCGEARSHSSVMAGFRGWLSDHGIIDESYEIRASKIDGAGNGLFVRGDEEISSGTVVVRVPSRVMLSSLHVQAQRASGSSDSSTGLSFWASRCLRISNLRGSQVFNSRSCSSMNAPKVTILFGSRT